MYPRTDSQAGFEYPIDRLLELKDILTQERMHHPGTTDHDGKTCLFAIKRSFSTLVTIGRATTFSCVREYFPDQTHRDSTEWAIVARDHQSDVFSECGDSGSLIASGAGEFGGLLTGGCGRKEVWDITYATPMFWLWPIIKAKFPNATLNPVFN